MAVQATAPPELGLDTGTDHLSHQQRGKSPSTGHLLCGMQSTADPTLTLDPLAFQILLEKTLESPSSLPLSPALPVQPST